MPKPLWPIAFATLLFLTSATPASASPAPADDHPVLFGGDFNAEPAAGPASAASDAKPSPASASESPWSVGGGVVFTARPSSPYAELFLAAIMSGASASPYLAFFQKMEPTANLVLEYRVLDRLFLVAQAVASGNYTDNGKTFSGNSYPRSSYDLSGNLAFGSRYLLNPGGLVELSLWGTAYAGGHRGLAAFEQKNNNGGDSEELYSKTEVLGYGVMVGGRGGIALEKQLLDNLYLRFQSSVVDVRFNWDTWESKTTFTDPANAPTTPPSKDVPTSWALNGGLAFNPSIELRLTF